MERCPKNKVCYDETDLAHELGMDFGDPVNSARPLDAEIRGRVSRRGGAKCPNGAGDEDSYGVLQGQV